MRMLKWLGLAVGALAGLALVAVALVVLFVDPNDYKDDIGRIVREQTGRELVLEGDLDLSVFPWLAIAFGPARLGDAPGFGDEPFLALERARLGIRLWPLLRGQVEIGTVTLDGVTVRLVTDEQGRDNWADLASSEPAEVTADGDSLATPTLAGIEITRAQVSYEDRRDNSRTTVRDLALETGALASGEPFDLRAAFVLEQADGVSARTTVSARITADFAGNVHLVEAPSIEATLTGGAFAQQGVPVSLTASRATVDAGREQYSASEVVLGLTWRGDGWPEDGVPVTLKLAGVEADLAAQTVALSGLDVDVAGARVAGQLTGREILDAPALGGRLVLDPVVPRDWLPKLGIEVPVTRDTQVLRTLALAADVALTSSSAELSNVALRLDDTAATGTLGIADFDSLALRFALDVDRIDVDRYLAPAPAEGAETSAAEPVEIPVERLRDLNLRGTLTVGEAVLSGIRFSRVRLGVAARDGTVRVNPAEAVAYGGQYRGDIGINAAGDVARLTLDQRMDNIEFAPLFADLFDSKRLSGKGSFTSQLVATGRDSDALLRSLSGALDFSVNDGAIEGTDLWYEIRRARALLRRQAIPERTGPERTAFTALRGSSEIKDGVVTSNDLTMAMQYLRVAGRASIDLPKGEIDSRVEATVLRIPAEGTDATGLQELVNARIPVRITGPLTDPTVRPDVAGMIKEQVREKVEEKIRETLQDRLRRALGGQ